MDVIDRFSDAADRRAAARHARLRGLQRLLSIEDVTVLTGLSERKIDELEEAGKFPKRVDPGRLGAKLRRYTSSSVERWISDLDENEEE